MEIIISRQKNTIKSLPLRLNNKRLKLLLQAYNKINNGLNLKLPLSLKIKLKIKNFK